MGASDEAVATEEAGPVVRRVVADRLEDRDPAADLVLAAVPRRLAHRLRLAGLAALRAGLRPRRAGTWASSPPRSSPRSSSGLIFGARIATSLMRQGPRAGPAVPLARRRSSCRPRSSCSRSRPTSWVAVVANAVIIGVARAILAPGILASLSLAIPPGPGRWGSRWRPVGDPRPRDPADHRLGRRHARPPGGHARSWSRRSSSAGSSSPRPEHVIADDIAEVWRATAARSEVAVRAPAGPVAAAARPRARRRLRRRAGALRRRLRGRGGRDASPCSARTAPASRRC